MVYHVEPLICLILITNQENRYKCYNRAIPRNNEEKEDLVDQLIIDRKTYEKNTQWVKEMRKYPDHETFAVGDLVLVNHPYGSVLQSPSRKLNRNWIGPVRIQTVLDNTHYFCSDWSGMLIPKRFHINRLKKYYMNLGEIDENSQLKMAENVRQLYDIWEDIKEDEMKEDSQTDKDMTENM